MNNNLNNLETERLIEAIGVDYHSLSKKTDKFRLDVDIKKINTYADLKIFYNDYLSYLSFLSKTQIEMILKNAEWTKTVYAILAANKFKNLLKKKHSLTVY